MLVCAANGAFVETRGLFGVELVAGDESCGTARAVDVDVDEGLELLVGDELGG